MEFIHWTLKENYLRQKSSISLHIVVQKIETFCTHSDPNKQLGTFYYYIFCSKQWHMLERVNGLKYSSNYVCKMRIEYMLGWRGILFYHLPLRKKSACATETTIPF